MERQIATLASDGRLVLTPEVQSLLGIPRGTSAELLISDQDVRVVVPERRVSAEETDRLLRELQAMFAGQPSLEDEYFRTRDKDKW